MVSRFFSVFLSYSRLLADLRRREHQLLAKVGMLTSLSLSITPAMPVVAVIATFLTHIASGNELTAAEVRKRH